MRKLIYPYLYEKIHIYTYIITELLYCIHNTIAIKCCGVKKTK